MIMVIITILSCHDYVVVFNCNAQPPIVSKILCFVISRTRLTLASNKVSRTKKKNKHIHTDKLTAKYTY